MEGHAEQPSCSNPLLLCCLCKSLLHDPVQLHCLHSCCRQCLSSTTSGDKSSHVTCHSCSRITQSCDAEPNTFVANLVRGYFANADTAMCSICKENGDTDVLALAWCGSCRQLLCGDCVPAHKRYNRNHCTQSLDELKSLEDPLLKAESRPRCPVHNEPLLFACFTCEKAKCLTCWAACNKSKHELSLVNDDSFAVGLQNLKSDLSSIEDEILKKCEVFEECKCVLSELKSARVVHLQKIQERKRLIIDTVENVYQEIELATRSMYDSVEMEAERVATVAANLEESVNFSRDYVHCLVGSDSCCDLWNQQKILRSHLISLSAELDKLTASIEKSQSICIKPSLPENLEHVLKSWIGQPRLDAGGAHSQHQSQLFRAPSGSIELPSECYDVALTLDGHVLLAARELGLIELCTSGHKLSQWLPPERDDGKGDDVEAVYALSDGRVGVGVFYAQVVVLLRRSIGSSSRSPMTWIEDRRLDRLHLHPMRLSVFEDTLAVSMWKFNEDSNCFDSGPGLMLLSLSNGKQSATMTREYNIIDITLTAEVIITASNDKVMLSNTRQTYVIDAHDRNSDARLWRHELLNDDEAIESVFPDFAGRILYVAFKMSDGSSGRVASISLEDGSEQRRSVLNFDDQRQPVRLSLDRSGAVVAALCKNGETEEQTMLTWHWIAMV